MVFRIEKAISLPFQVQCTMFDSSVFFDEQYVLAPLTKIFSTASLTMPRNTLKDRFTDEQVLRYNNRTTKEKFVDDADRFQLALSQVAGKRLTFEEMTGKVWRNE